MPRVYFDNAATSFPKPPAVARAMADYAHDLGASPGRGAYAEAREAGELLAGCREDLTTLIGGSRAENLIFTLNASDALNLAIKGILHEGNPRRHAITTWMDHNSVLRPLNELVSRGVIEQTRVPADPETGLVDPDDIAAAMRPDTGLVAVVHGSNVTGTLQPIRTIGEVCRDRGVPLLVDAAQTLGHVPLNVRHDLIDLLAFPGHKGLLGPLGTGALYIRPGLEAHMRTLREGGTGSISEQDVQPDFMPDRFEPGSHNAIGLIGLGEGVRWVARRGIEQLWQHERELTAAMLDGLLALDGLTLYGPHTPEHRCGVFSIRIDTHDARFRQPQALSDLLERDFDLLTRSGIHCAPLAHQTLSTHALGGTTRFSLGPFNTLEHIELAVDALGEVCSQRALVAV